jgi:hypothetical protein
MLDPLEPEIIEAMKNVSDKGIGVSVNVRVNMYSPVVKLMYEDKTKNTTHVFPDYSHVKSFLDGLLIGL